MEKEFVPYEESYQLKTLGFAEPCFAYYGEINGGEIELFLKRNFDTEAKYLLAPTFSQAFRWFRDYHHWPIDSWVQPYLSEQPKQYEGFYWTRGEKKSVGIFSTHKEAELNCLRTLIKIVKNK